MAESLEIIMLSNLLRGMWLIFGHLTYCTDARMLLQCNGYRYWSWFSNREALILATFSLLMVPELGLG